MAKGKTTVEAIFNFMGKDFRVFWEMAGPIPRTGEYISMIRIGGVVKNVIWKEDRAILIIDGPGAYSLGASDEPRPQAS